MIFKHFFVNFYLVDEYIMATIVRCDETPSFCDVEPLAFSSSDSEGCLGANLAGAASFRTFK